MCGRYSLAIPPNELERLVQETENGGYSRNSGNDDSDNSSNANYVIDEVIDSDKFQPRYNLAPTHYGAVVRNVQSDKEGEAGNEEKKGKKGKKGEKGSDSEKQHQVLHYMKWGLVPLWTKSQDQVSKTQYKTFNARADTVLSSKSMWSSVKNSKRCVVPIEGYYEWIEVKDSPPSGKSKSKAAKKHKQPYFVCRKDGGLMFLAGLWERTKFAEGTELYSYTIVTTDAPKYLSWLHTRQPVILRPGTEEFDEWLDVDRKLDLDLGKKCLSSYPFEEDLKWYPVSTDVGKVGNEGEYLKQEVKLEDDKKPKNSSTLDSFFNQSKKGVKRESKALDDSSGDGSDKESGRNLRETSTKDLHHSKKVKTEDKS